MTEATPRPWTVEQAGKPSPLDEGVYDANHNHVNLYQHLDLIVSAVNKHDQFENAVRNLEAPLVAAKRGAEQRAAHVAPLMEALDVAQNVIHLGFCKRDGGECWKECREAREAWHAAKEAKG